MAIVTSDGRMIVVSSVSAFCFVGSFAFEVPKGRICIIRVFKSEELKQQKGQRCACVCACVRVCVCVCVCARA